MNEQQTPQRSRYDKLLPLFIIAALLLGGVLGLLCTRSSALASAIVPTATWMGVSFMNLLKVLVIPLVFSSLVSGVMNLGSSRSVGRLGGKTILLYCFTSAIAIVTGLILVNWIQPGVGVSVERTGELAHVALTQRSISDILLNIFPSNIVQSMASNEMLHLIIFALLFGIFATKVAERYRTLLAELFEAIFAVMMKMTGWVIRLAPLGIFGLVVREVSRHTDLSSVLAGVGLFVATVACALAFHFFITLPLTVRLLGRANPFAHLRNMATPLLTAFSTASSAAALPLTMEAVESRSGVSNRISSFCLPLGATINMDGTALFECVAVVFVAQTYGVELSFATQLVIVFTALITSIGAAGIPMASIVMITIILTAVGLPLEGLTIILAVDFLLDMLRTTTNVWSDSCVAVVVAKSEGEKLTI